MRASALADVFELFTMLYTPVDNLLHRCAPRRRPMLDIRCRERSVDDADDGGPF